MAHIIYAPDQHDCHSELRELDHLQVNLLPLGTVAECSCGKQYIKRDTQFHGRYWDQITY